MAALFSLWVVIVTAGRADDVVAKYGLSPIGIVGSYFASGAAAGALVGFFRPATQYRLGAFLVGCAAGTLVYGAGLFATTGKLETSDIVIAAILGTLVGGGIADSQFSQRAEKQG
jgi:hypothetical protein